MPLQSAAYRRFLMLPENGPGARVDSLLPIPAPRLSCRGRRILQIGEYPSAVRDNSFPRLTACLARLLFKRCTRGKRSAQVWRKGKELDLELPVFYYEGDRNVGNQYGALPRYFVYGVWCSCL